MLITDCKKLILASGTLEPTEEFDCLQKYYDDSDSKVIDKYSCSHVIEDGNFKCFTIE